MKGSGSTLFVVALALLAGAVGPGTAAGDDWVSDGNPLCMATGGQTKPRICADGAGGAFVAWEDQRNGARIFLTHVTGSGTIAVGWPANGVDVSSIGSSSEFDQVLMPDGAGGVYVGWSDDRDPTGSRAFVKRLNGDGTVATGWPTNGVIVSNFFQTPRALLPDGAGGVLVIVSEYFSLTDVTDLFAHHVLPAGTQDPSWPAGGRSLLGTQPQVHVASARADGSGGLVVAWSSGSFPSRVTRALHFGSDAIADPAWPSSGLRLCSGGLADFLVDESGGGYAVVSDLRATDPDGGLYVQRFTSAGAVADGWDAEGAPLCAASGSVGTCFVSSDDAGGMIAGWDDFRDGFEDQNIYARRISPDGTSPIGWDVQGNQLCAAPFGQELKGMIPDSQGGAIACWYDHRGGTATFGDVYAQRVGPNGSVVFGWPADGQAICTNALDQDLPVLATDGHGGAIVAWRDYRNQGESDIYVGRVRQDAVTPVLAAVARTVVEPDRVRVVWRVDGARGSSVAVERAVEDGAWQARGIVWVDGLDEAIFDDHDVIGGVRYGYRIVVGDMGPLGEIHLQTPEIAALALRGLTPNPARGTLVVSFTLSRSGRCQLEVVDLSGRCVMARELGVLSPGEHRVPLGARVAPGVYQLVLTSGDQRVTAHGCILD